MDNWFPTTSDVMLRKGSAQHAHTIGADVETIAVYKPHSGSNEMWAWADDSLYDATSSGAVGAAAVSSLNSAQWQWTNATTAGGNFILAVNGQDNLLYYNGTSWTSITGISSPAITGVNTADLIHLNQYKGRVFYIQKASMSAWYTAVGAITGAVTKFDLGSIFRQGGYLMAMGTWTIDGGEGVDDYAVFVTSEGEVAVYQGTDPSSTATWALVGIYSIGSPIGRRCLQKLGGDLLIITVDGVVPASKAFISGRSTAAAITDRIQGAMTSVASLYKSSFGWELTHFPEANMLIMNVPVSGGVEQFVMNTTTKRWCRFKDWEAKTFAVFNGELYYGMDGEVRKAWTGKSDLGEIIEGDLVPAFAQYGKGQTIFRMVRPIAAWDSNPAEILVGMDVDYTIKEPTGAVAFTVGAGSVWDTGAWDTAIWGGDLTVNKNWYSVDGVGYSGTPHMKVRSSTSEVRVSAYQVVYEPGGIL